MVTHTNIHSITLKYTRSLAAGIRRYKQGCVHGWVPRGYSAVHAAVTSLSGSSRRVARVAVPAQEPNEVMLLALLLLLFVAVSATPTGVYRCPHPQPAGASKFRTGDLMFVRPQLDAHSPLDAGILATGAATITWLRAQGVAVPGNETATHVAMAWVNDSTGCLSFVQAVPPVVTETSAVDLWHSTLPTTTFYRAWFRDSALQAQLAQAALAAATTQLGKPYAHDFEPPPSEFYCSSLVEWSYRTAASGRRVFLPPSVPNFTLIFEPHEFWEQYYKELGLALPVNVTGSNPTLLLHSPAMSHEAVDTTYHRPDDIAISNAEADSTEHEHGGNQVMWSGYNWSVKDSLGSKAGPGPNYFSKDNIVVDPAGKLHLSIIPIDGSTAEWSCAEIMLPSDAAMGFGRYRWILETPLAALGGNGHFANRPVLGLFLYKDDSHEIDIEMSRWYVALDIICKVLL